MSNLHCPLHPPLQEGRLPHWISSASSGVRKSASKLSSSSARTPTVTSGLKTGSLSSSLDRSSSLSGRKKTTTHESWDSRFIVLQQVEIKASDDLLSQLRVFGEGTDKASTASTLLVGHYPTIYQPTIPLSKP
ncbi:hypothetical protein ACFX15_028073 [Malus domestica]